MAHIRLSRPGSGLGLSHVSGKTNNTTTTTNNNITTNVAKDNIQALLYPEPQTHRQTQTHTNIANKNKKTQKGSCQSGATLYISWTTASHILRSVPFSSLYSLPRTCICAPIQILASRQLLASQTPFGIKTTLGIKTFLGSPRKTSLCRRERIFDELMTSDLQLKASKEGSKYGLRDLKDWTTCEPRHLAIKTTWH